MISGLAKLENLDIDSDKVPIKGNEPKINKGLQKLMEVGSRIDHIDSIKNKSNSLLEPNESAEPEYQSNLDYGKAKEAIDALRLIDNRKDTLYTGTSNLESLGANAPQNNTFLNGDSVSASKNVLTFDSNYFKPNFSNVSGEANNLSLPETDNQSDVITQDPDWDIQYQNKLKTLQKFLEEKEYSKFNRVMLPGGERAVGEPALGKLIPSNPDVKISPEKMEEINKIYQMNKESEKPKNYKALKEFQKDLDKIEYLNKKYSAQGAEYNAEDENELMKLINKRNTLVGIHNNLTYGEKEDYKLFNAQKKINGLKNKINELKNKSDFDKDLSNVGEHIYSGVLNALNMTVGVDYQGEIKSDIRKDETNKNIENEYKEVYKEVTEPKTLFGQVVQGLATTAALAPMFAFGFNAGGVKVGAGYLKNLVAAAKGSALVFAPGGASKGIQKTVAEVKNRESKGEQLDTFDRIWIGTKNIGGEVLKNTMEGVSEIMIPGFNPGKTFLKSILVNAPLNIITETATEQVSDITGDLVDGTNTSLLVSLLRTGKFSEESINQVLVEAIIGGIYGSAVGGGQFWAGHLQENLDKKDYATLEKYIQENKSTLEKNLGNVIDKTVSNTKEEVSGKIKNTESTDIEDKNNKFNINPEQVDPETGFTNFPELEDNGEPVNQETGNSDIPEQENIGNKSILSDKDEAENEVKAIDDKIDEYYLNALKLNEESEEHKDLMDKINELEKDQRSIEKKYKIRRYEEWYSNEREDETEPNQSDTKSFENVGAEDIPPEATKPIENIDNEEIPQEVLPQESDVPIIPQENIKDDIIPEATKNENLAPEATKNKVLAEKELVDELENRVDNLLNSNAEIPESIITSNFDRVKDVKEAMRMAKVLNRIWKHNSRIDIQSKSESSEKINSKGIEKLESIEVEDEPIPTQETLNREKLPYEMTSIEYTNTFPTNTQEATFAKARHEQEVINAYIKKLPIPKKVLAEYPRLKQKAQKLMKESAEYEKKKTLRENKKGNENYEKAQDVVLTNLNDVNTDEKRFQNRLSLNKSKLDNIVNNYNESEFDPIHLWRDKDNKLYLLSGHHRLEAAKQLGLDKVKSIIRTDLDEKGAIDYATVRSNTNRSMETPVERAQIYRKMRDEGVSENEIQKRLKEVEDKNSTRINNLSFLNPVGKTMIALSQTGDNVAGANILNNAADYIGEALKRNSTLTDAHEDEMFTFLIENGQIDKFNSKLKFLDKLDMFLGSPEFNRSRPLGLNGFNTLRGERTIQIDKELESLRRERKQFESDRKKFEEGKIQLPKGKTPEQFLGEFSNKILETDKRITELTKERILSAEEDKNQIDLFQDATLINERRGAYNADQLTLEFDNTNSDSYIDGDKNKIRFKSAKEESLLPNPTRKVESDRHNAPPSYRKLQQGEICAVERRYKKYKQLNFYSAKEKITSPEDVAYIFRSLEGESVEHAFILHITKSGKQIVQHLTTGTFNSSLVSRLAIQDAIDRFDTKEIYFIHNHPTGNLVPSDEDIKMSELIDKSLKEGVILKNSLIINIRSGKFITFNDRYNVRTNKEIKDLENYKVSSKKKITPLTFSTQVFKEDVTLRNKIKSPEDAAQFVSAARFSEGEKNIVLSLNSQNEIVGMFVLTTQSNDIKGIVDEIGTLVARSGGINALLVNNKLKPATNSATNYMLYTLLKQKDITLFDILNVSPDTKKIERLGVQGIINENKEPYSSKELTIEDAASEEGVRRKDLLLGQKAIEISYNELLDDTELGKMRSKAEEIYKKLKPTKNKFNGHTVEFIKRGFKKIKSHSADNNYLKIIPSLDVIYENAIPLFSEDTANKDERGNITSYNHYATKINIEGKEHYIRLVTFQNKGGREFLDYFYDSYLKEADKIKAGLKSQPNPALKAGGTQSQTHIDKLITWLDKVKEYENTGGIKKGGELYQKLGTQEIDFNQGRSGSQLLQDRRKHLELVIDNPKSSNKVILEAKKELIAVNKKLYRINLEESQLDAFDNADDVLSLFQIIGEKGAKNLDKAEESLIRIDNLSIAREMEAEGKDANNIRLATGWERGNDNKWKYEIEDGNLINKKVKEGTDIPLGEIFNAPELYNAYPNLKDAKIQLTPGFSYTKGNTLYLNDNFINKVKDGNFVFKPEAKSTLIHEIQHLIQSQEGFAIGTSPELEMVRRIKNFRKFKEEAQKISYLESIANNSKENKKLLEIINDYALDNNDITKEQSDDAYNKYINSSEYKAFNEQAIKFQQEYKIPYDEVLRYNTADKFASYENAAKDYNKSSGEVEARNVESRNLLSSDERRTKLLKDTEDVNREEQKNIFNNLEIIENIQKNKGAKSNSSDVQAKVDNEKSTRPVYNNMSEREKKEFLRITTDAFLEENPEIFESDLSVDNATAKSIIRNSLKTALAFDPKTADIKTAIHEANHLAILNLLPEWKARRLLRENGWNGRGDYKSPNSNESLRDAYEALAKANENWYEGTKEFKGKRITGQFLTFLKNLWNKLAGFLYRRGLITQAGFFENLYTGKLKNVANKKSQIWQQSRELQLPKEATKFGYSYILNENDFDKENDNLNNENKNELYQGLPELQEDEESIHEYGTYLFEKGNTKYSDWIKQMQKVYGEDINYATQFARLLKNKSAKKESPVKNKPIPLEDEKVINAVGDDVEHRGKLIRMRERTFILEKIKQYKKGYREGRSDTKKELEFLKNQIATYAREYLPRTLEKYRITPLFTEIAKATRIEDVESSLKRIDDYVYKDEKNSLISTIYHLLKSYSPKKEKGVLKGKQLTADEYALLGNIKAIVEMRPEYIEKIRSEFIERVEEKGLEFDDQMDEFFYQLNLFGDLDKKTPKQLQQVIDELNSIIKNGITQRQMQREKDGIRRAGLVTKIVNEITKDSRGVLSEQEMRAINEKDSYVTKKLKAITNLLNPAYYIHNLESLFDSLTFDKSTGMYEGTLNKYFIPLIKEAHRNQFAWESGKKEELQKVLKKIYKITDDELTPELKLTKILNKNKEVIKHTGAFYLNKRTGDMKELKLSQNEAAKKWMEYQDKLLRPTFDEMGWSDSTIEQIEEFLTPEVKRWAEYQLYELYPKIGKEVNKVYREYFGVDMPTSENYSPLTRDFEKLADDQGGLLSSAKTHYSSVVNGHLKARVSNTRPLKSIDMDVALGQQIVQMGHFIAFADAVREMRLILQNEELQRAISQNHGYKYKDAVNLHVDDLARGGTNRTNSIIIIEKALRKFVPSVLGLNPSITLKQLTSLPAYSAEIPREEFLKGIADFMANPITAVRILSNTKYLKSRYGKGFERDLISLMQKMNSNAFAGSKSVKDALMFMITLGDKGATYLGGWSVYKYHYDKAIKEGKSISEAKKIAETEFQSSTDRTQQSGELEDLSLFQKEGTYGRILTLFMTQPASYFRQEMGAIRNLKRGRGKRSNNLYKLALYHIGLPAIFQYVASGFPGFLSDWDDEDEKRLERAMVLGSFNGLFVIGNFLEYFYNIIRGGSPYRSSTTNIPLQQVPDSFFNTIVKLNKIIDNEKYLDMDFKEVLKTLDIIMMSADKMTGIPYYSVKRITQGAQDIINKEGSPVKVLGYSDYSLGDDKKNNNTDKSTRVKYKSPRSRRTKLNRKMR